MDTPDPSFVLEIHQKELESILKEKHEKVAKIYLGAILVLRQFDNPDRVSLCAHGVRELINSLPRFIDVPIVKEARQQLGNFADALQLDWQKVVDEGIWPGKPPWTGEINTCLRVFLERAMLLVEAHASIREGRRTQVKEIIKKQNFSAVPLPETIEDLKAKEWDEYRNYFTRVAHHSSTNEGEFLQYLTNFEYLLLNYLKPRTFDTHAELLKEIEGVQNGQ